jgi:hypothetical protein
MRLLTPQTVRELSFRNARGLAAERVLPASHLCRSAVPVKVERVVGSRSDASSLEGGQASGVSQGGVRACEPIALRAQLGLSAWREWPFGPQRSQARHSPLHRDCVALLSPLKVGRV